jgi:hypothetical protein
MQEILATIADTLADLKYPNDPASLKEAQLDLSEAYEWCAAMKEKFTSIKEMDVYKPILHYAILDGCKIMKG